jgi:hypothetical protein
MTPRRPSSPEATARARKALALLQVLHETGCDASTALAFTLADRANAAKAAGVHEPSGDTWAVVVSLLRRNELEADVFAGLPK